MMASKDFDIIPLALLGIALGLFWKRRAVFFPFSWLCLAIIILSRHRPVWNHYYPLVSIPLCWLAGMAAGWLWTENARQRNPLKKTFFALLFLVFLLPALAMLPYKYERTWKSLLDPEATSVEKNVVDMIAARKQHARWLLTDRPIFAFRCGVLTPPQTPVSKKSVAQGLLDARLLQTYHPEAVLWARLNNIPEDVQGQVEKLYDLRLDERFEYHFKRIAPAAASPAETRLWRPRFLPRRLAYLPAYRLAYLRTARLAHLLARWSNEIAGQVRAVIFPEWNWYPQSGFVKLYFRKGML
jgi:hypothetical protein